MIFLDLLASVAIATSIGALVHAILPPGGLGLDAEIARARHRAKWRRRLKLRA